MIDPAAAASIGTSSPVKVRAGRTEGERRDGSLDLDPRLADRLRCLPGKITRDRLRPFGQDQRRPIEDGGAFVVANGASVITFLAVATAATTSLGPEGGNRGDHGIVERGTNIAAVGTRAPAARDGYSEVMAPL